MKKKIINYVLFFIFIFILIYMVILPKEIMESVSFSINIWINNLFPTLFPFLILSYFFNSYGISIILSELIKPFVEKVLGIRGICGYTIVLSMFSGFPSSSKFIKDLLDNNEIDIDEATHLLSLCHFSSPLFVVGTIGSSILFNQKIGILILISHYLGAFITSFFFRNNKEILYTKMNLRMAFKLMDEKRKKNKAFASVLTNAIKQGLDTMFLLLGIITFFLIISEIFLKSINMNQNLYIILSGILEMTQGIKNTALANFEIKKQAFICLSFISFGGLSIHTQVFSILDNYNISYLKYFIARILHVFFSIFILYFLFIVC